MKNARSPINSRSNSILESFLIEESKTNSNSKKLDITEELEEKKVTDKLDHRKNESSQLIESASSFE